MNTSNGQMDQEVSVYYAAVPLEAAEAVESVTLPDVSQQAVEGSPAMHVFAMTISFQQWRCMTQIGTATSLEAAVSDEALPTVPILVGRSPLHQARPHANRVLAPRASECPVRGR